MIAENRPTVAIVGGGFSGAAVAYHLVDLIVASGARVVVFEPRARLGVGLAYDTRNLAHRINVPADKMSLIPGDEGHFVRWLERTGAIETDSEARLPDGRLFPRREVFGDYVVANIRPFLTSGLIEHKRAFVSDIVHARSGWWVVDDSGRRLEAETVVIATTHPSPTLPRELKSLRGDKRLIADATAPDCLADLPLDAHILIVGAGLTMADFAATLHERRHRGRILALSRHGLLSRGHARTIAEPMGDFRSPPERSALSLLQRIRRAVREAETGGPPWQAIFDAVRRQGRDIWSALPIAERRKLVSRLRSYWDAHRFRVAPMVEAAIADLVAEERLRVVAARLVEAEALEDKIAVAYRLRGECVSRREQFDRVVVATGPAHDDILAQQPALAHLNSEGYIQLDPLGLGLWCDEEARLLDIYGDITPGLLVAGPLARGTFGELMGLAEVTEFAAFVASGIAREISERGRRENACAATF